MGAHDYHFSANQCNKSLISDVNIPLDSPPPLISHTEIGEQYMYLCHFKAPRSRIAKKPQRSTRVSNRTLCNIKPLSFNFKRTDCMSSIRHIFISIIIAALTFFSLQAQAQTCTLNGDPISCGDDDTTGGGGAGGGGRPPGPVVVINPEPIKGSVDKPPLTKESIVEQYKPPCQGATESSSAYTARAIQDCTRVTTTTAISENPILRLNRAATVVTMNNLCTLHIAVQTTEGKIKSCPSA
jgi:hypothetical protein